MINFIVVTHGEFGAYLVEAAESIVGRQARGVRVVAISSRLSVPEIKGRIRMAIEELASPEGLVLFCDMPGGTPGNLSFPLLKDVPKAEMISGVNLYMLVCAFSHREDLPLDRLVEKIIADGQRSIRDIRQMFLTRVR
ncbi:MAG: hypothetical protein AAB320_05095 [Elusimicrobiota bacterium]